MKALVNYNGNLMPANAADRWLKRQPPYRAFALLETMRWENGGIPLLAYHFRRLFQGLAAYGFAATHTFHEKALAWQLSATVAANNLTAGARVRMQVFLQIIENGCPAFLMECQPLPPRTIPLSVGLAKKVFIQRSRAAGFKTNHRAVYEKAAQEANAAGWDEALLCNDAGRIVESTVANIFWVEGERWLTPPLTEGCVAGVMRAYLLDTLPAAKVRVAEALLTLERLFHADAVFLTNALRGIRPVRNISGSETYSTGRFVSLRPF